MSSTKPATGSAEKWGALWGARARDWGEDEELQLPTYEVGLRRAEVAPGHKVLDIGCGTGVFLRLVADHGAEPFGLDASASLLEIARERVPDVNLRVGEMERLPYEDAGFDLVTGFNSFFFAEDMVAALREAGRVAKPGARVLIQVWGAPERCDLEAMKEVARQYIPPPPADAPPPLRLWEPGVLEEFAGRAGITPEARFATSYASRYADDETLGRLLAAPMGLGDLVGPEREPRLREDILHALSPHPRPDGSYELRNEFQCLLARA